MADSPPKRGDSVPVPPKSTCISASLTKSNYVHQALGGCVGEAWHLSLFARPFLFPRKYLEAVWLRETTFRDTQTDGVQWLASGRHIRIVG